MNKYLVIASLILAIIGTIILTRFFTPKPEGTIFIHDTTTLTRYQTELKRDTIIKWYEKIVWKEVKPEIIYSQKVDSIFIETIKYKDLMLKIEKKGNNLKIFAVNISDSLIKEYNFADVGQDFTATSTTGNIFVKSKKLYWTGFEPYLNYSLNNLKWKEGEFNIGLRTGLEYNNIYVKPYFNYNTSLKDLRGGLELGYTLK